MAARQLPQLETDGEANTDLGDSPSRGESARSDGIGAAAGGKGPPPATAAQPEGSRQLPIQAGMVVAAQPVNPDVAVLITCLEKGYARETLLDANMEDLARQSAPKLVVPMGEDLTEDDIADDDFDQYIRTFAWGYFAAPVCRGWVAACCTHVESHPPEF
jgi:hypothetical protein